MSTSTPPTRSSSSTSIATSASASSSSSSKSFWPRSLIYASPHPSQLSGGWQWDRAPMCPCQECWEYGSHSPRRANAPRPPKAKKTTPSHSSSASPSEQTKKSKPSFLKRNASSASVASDMRPLRQSTTLASSASAYEVDC